LFSEPFTYLTLYQYPVKMKKSLSYALFFLFSILLPAAKSIAQDAAPDTVKTGIYITSIHGIDFKESEYTITFWLWMTYKRKEFDLLQNLEIPQAKTVTKSFSTIDTSDGKLFILMKIQCVMKDSWKINNFPFDRQKLRLSVENSQFDSHDLVFAPDTFGKNYDPRFTLRGWRIDSFRMAAGIKAYETTFGDETLPQPHVEYSSFDVNIGIGRDGGELFWKMFLGMYVAFLIAYVCFYIHADNIDSRFGLSVGSLFACVGNKYIIDSALPDSTVLTLVDILHGITLLFIFVIITCSAYSLKLFKAGKIRQANRFDIIIGQVLLASYIILNAWFILTARNS